MGNLAELLNESLNAPADPIQRLKDELRARRREELRQARIKLWEGVFDGVDEATVKYLMPHTEECGNSLLITAPGHHPIEAFRSDVPLDPYYCEWGRFLVHIPRRWWFGHWVVGRKTLAGALIAAEVK